MKKNKKNFWLLFAIVSIAGVTGLGFLQEWFGTNNVFLAMSSIVAIAGAWVMITQLNKYPHAEELDPPFKQMNAIKVKFQEWDCFAVGHRYRNGRKAIELTEIETGDPVATATVNLINARPTSWDHVFIKDYSENEGMEKALIKAGIIDRLSVETVQGSYVDFNEFALTPKGLKLWSNE